MDSEVASLCCAERDEVTTDAVSIASSTVEPRVVRLTIKAILGYRVSVTICEC